MKKRLFSILLALTLCLTMLPATALAEDSGNVAKIGETEYATLAEAIAAVPENGSEPTIITVLRDVTDAVGITVDGNKSFTVDFDNHTYTVKEPGAGSEGTETNAFQLIKGNTVTFKNGTIQVAEENLERKPNTSANDGSDWNIKMIIMNYSNLTLENMTLDGTNLYQAYYGSGENRAPGANYTLSNVCGTVSIKDSTIKAKTGNNVDYTGTHYAFDVDYRSGYSDGTQVTVENSTIVGDIEVTTAAKSSLTVKSGSFTDIAAAVKYAKDGASIKLADDVTVSSTIEVAKKLTLDLNGKTITGKNGEAGCRVFQVTGSGDLTLTGTGTVTTANGNDDNFANSGSVIRVGSNGTTGDAKLTVDKSVTIIAPASLGVSIFGKEASLSLTVKGTIKSSSADGAAIVGNGSAGLAATNITIEPTAALYSANDYVIYHPQAGTLTIKGGTITGVGGIEAKAGNTIIEVSGDPVITATGKTSHTENNNGTSTTGYALAVVENKNYTGGATMNIASGYFTGEIGIEKDNETEKAGTIAVTGGYFTADPSAYVAKGSYVHPSDKSGYTYMVNDTAPEAAEVTAKSDTSASISSDAQNALSAIDPDYTAADTSVENVDDALKNETFVNSVDNSILTDAASSNAIVTVDIQVNVTVTNAALEKEGETTTGTLTFEAEPVADIYVGTEKKTTESVAVSNSMLNGEAITVTLPLPTGFVPRQIKHVSQGYATEYFLNKALVGSKRGAKTFEIKDINGVSCAVFQITHFSTFEVSGDVTYTEPPIVTSKPAHDVDVKKAANGSVTVNQDEARQGSIVTITAAPDAGYTLESLTVLDKNGNALTLNSLGGNKYSFIMPDGDVTVRASFTNGSAAAFVDVPAGKYFSEPVAWAVASGITGGTDATHFSPYASCTRGQLVTFLWRAAGEPAAEGAKGFSDVKSTSSFYKAILWAAENGIVGGYADGTFHPNAAVTRQQVAAILYRYAQYAKMDVSVGEDTNILSFNDAFEVSEYAIAAFQWAVGEGVITGNEGNLLPHDTCTRAQIVTMLYRLLAD